MHMPLNVHQHFITMTRTDLEDLVLMIFICKDFNGKTGIEIIYIETEFVNRHNSFEESEPQITRSIDGFSKHQRLTTRWAHTNDQKF